MSTADARAVLLARPGEARDRLRTALEQAGIDVVLEADPLAAGPDEIAATGACNLVIAVDVEVEEALERFDPLLADPRYRILFEEAGVVNARDGWDVARWSRHLGAKLLGHGDVLPSGHEGDGDVAGADGLDEAAAADAGVFDGVAPDESIAEGTTLSLSTEDTESASAMDLDDVALGGSSAFASIDAPDWSLGADAGETGEAVSDAADAALPEPATDAAMDWTRFQDFDAVNDLPAANAPQATEADYRAALAPLEESGLDHDAAYEQIHEEAAQFDRAAPTDRWQDFERPTAEDEAEPAKAAPEAPVAPSDWSLSDEPLSIATETAPASEDISRFNARIANFALVEEHVPGEGAIVLVGGIGGPDPLRQILQQLKPGLGAPVLVQQWLDGGQYDRLVRQMDRATDLPVQLATPGEALKPAHVYIVPVAVGLDRDANGEMMFTEAETRGFADLLSALPAASSGVFLLSGSGEEFVEPVLRFQQSGGRIYAQAAEGCYDHAVPALLISRGAEAQLPSVLASQLAARWQQQDSEE